jgi:hypothetical protein
MYLIPLVHLQSDRQPGCSVAYMYTSHFSSSFVLDADVSPQGLVRRMIRMIRMITKVSEHPLLLESLSHVTTRLFRYGR